MTKSDTNLPPKPLSNGFVGLIFQQRLPGFYVVYIPWKVVVTLVVIAVLCIPLGIVSIVCSSRSISYDFRYDNISNYKFQMSSSTDLPYKFPFMDSTYSMGKTTYLPITIEKTLKSPSLIKYRLTRYYQNFRTFSISKDESQIDGGQNLIMDDCKPFKYPGEIQKDLQSGFYSPCGSIPWALFNDSFRLYKLNSEKFNGNEIPSDAILICDGALFDSNGNSVSSSNKCSKKGISLNALKKSFSPPSENTKNSGPMWSHGGNSASSDPFLKHGYYYREPGHEIPETIDEDFVLWAFTAYLPDVRNLYRIIDVDLEPGDYLFDITELYPVPGEKHVILEKDTMVGASHFEIGGVLFSVGILSVVSAILVFLIRFPYAMM